MKKNEPKNDCPTPFPLCRNDNNISPNDNYFFDQNKVNELSQGGYQGFRNKNNNINENLKIKIGITFNELESLTKENLIQLIQFINSFCKLYLKNIKYNNCCCSIFEIKENLNRNGYNIVISKNKNNELQSNINENNIILENNEKFCNTINNEKGDNFYEAKKPISCPNHNNIKFNTLSSYLIHYKEEHKRFTCQDCGKVFEDFQNFKSHNYKEHNIEDENINIDIKDNDAPPLLKDSIESYNLENNIKCTKCELTFDSIDKKLIHYYEAHEKKIAQISKINEEFQQNKEQSINKSCKEFSDNRIEVNENKERIINSNQKEEENKKSEKIKKESTFEMEEGKEINEEIIKEKAIKSERKFLQRKTNLDKEESKEKIKKKKELRRKDELKRRKSIKRQEELNKQKGVKGSEKLKMKEIHIKQDDLKREEEIGSICCYDKKTFPTLKLYFEHFRKEHTTIHNIYGKGIESKYLLKNHYNSKIEKYNIFICKICGKAFETINDLKNHCKYKKH